MIADDMLERKCTPGLTTVDDMLRRKCTPGLMTVDDMLQRTCTPGLMTTDDMFVCVEVLQPSQPNVVMLSMVSLRNHKFTRLA